MFLTQKHSTVQLLGNKWLFDSDERPIRERKPCPLQNKCNLPPVLIKFYCNTAMFTYLQIIYQDSPGKLSHLHGFEKATVSQAKNTCKPFLDQFATSWFSRLKSIKCTVPNCVMEFLNKEGKGRILLVCFFLGIVQVG